MTTANKTVKDLSCTSHNMLHTHDGRLNVLMYARLHKRLGYLDPRVRGADSQKILPSHITSALGSVLIGTADITLYASPKTTYLF